VIKNILKVLTFKRIDIPKVSEVQFARNTDGTYLSLMKLPFILWIDKDWNT